MTTAPAARRGYAVDEGAFDRWTPEALYWAGLLFADGSLGCGRSVELTLTESDGAHVFALRDFLRSEHRVKVKLPHGYAGTKPALHLAVGSVRLVRRLVAVGMGPKADRLPAEPLASSIDFWRGVVDGDAWVGMRGNGYPVVSLSGYLPMLRRFVVFVEATLDLHLTINPHSSIYRTDAFGPKAVTLARALYEGAGVALARKRAAAAKILSAA